MPPSTQPPGTSGGSLPQTGGGSLPILLGLGIALLSGGIATVIAARRQSGHD